MRSSQPPKRCETMRHANVSRSRSSSAKTSATSPRCRIFWVIALKMRCREIWYPSGRWIRLTFLLQLFSLRTDTQSTPFQSVTFQIIDSECFLHSYDFLCSLLQPSCQLSYSSKQNELFVKPYQICRDYCQTFKDSCLSRIPQKFLPYFDCDKFPEVTFMGSCRAAPPADCLSELKRQGNSLRICDGIIDCPRGEDELSCSYCPQNSVHCNGRGRLCISRDKHCDGVLDCPDGR